MAICQVSNFAVDCGEGSGSAVVAVRQENAVAKAIFICSSGAQLGGFSPIGSIEFETEGSTTVEFACSEIELESLAEALNRIHLQSSISIADDKEEKRTERITKEHMTGTLDEVIDGLGLEHS
jgi:hypothetical protein